MEQLERERETSGELAEMTRGSASSTRCSSGDRGAADRLREEIRTLTEAAEQEARDAR